MNISPQWELVAFLAVLLLVVFVAAAVTGWLEGRKAPMRLVIGMLLMALGQRSCARLGPEGMD